MMKKIAFISALSMMALTAWSQEKYTIEGYLTGVDQHTKVFLGYYRDGIYEKDSVVTNNGKFTFSGEAKLPVKATLEIKAPRPEGKQQTAKRPVLQDLQVFYLESGTVRVTGDHLSTANITAGKVQDDYIRLAESTKTLRKKSEALSQKLVDLWRKSDTTGRAALMKQSNGISSAIAAAEEAFIRANPDSYVSFDLIKSKANYLALTKFDSLYNGLSASLRNTEAGKELGQRLEITKKTAIGNPAFNFTQNTSDQKPFTLSSLKGKYVLIDFWASWCGPCRAENPYLIKAYAEFKDRDFEIVSVSLDEKKAAWLEAIEKDKLPWIHVSDLKGWYNEVAVAYAIRAIPRNFLLDPNGIIVAKNLREDDLHNKLTELLGK